MQWRNAKFTETSLIDCEVNHPKLGWIPFTADPADTGANFDVAAMFAEMALVAEGYVEEDGVVDLAGWRERAVVSKITFCNRAADAGILSNEDAVRAALGQWPADPVIAGFLTLLTAKQKREAEIEWAASTEVRRMNVYLLTMQSLLELTDEAVDALFVAVV